MKNLILPACFALLAQGCAGTGLPSPTIEARKYAHDELKAHVQETLREAQDWKNILATP